jgi:hypothetical protein
MSAVGPKRCYAFWKQVMSEMSPSNWGIALPSSRLGRWVKMSDGPFLDVASSPRRSGRQGRGSDFRAPAPLALLASNQ